MYLPQKQKKNKKKNPCISFTYRGRVSTASPAVWGKTGCNNGKKCNSPHTQYSGAHTCRDLEKGQGGKGGGAASPTRAFKVRPLVLVITRTDPMWRSWAKRQKHFVRRMSRECQRPPSEEMRQSRSNSRGSRSELDNTAQRGSRSEEVALGIIKVAAPSGRKPRGIINGNLCQRHDQQGGRGASQQKPELKLCMPYAQDPLVQMAGNPPAWILLSIAAPFRWAVGSDRLA
ncbi:hypothetical protein IF1G_06373 [Cordyceps javanica]|uniref:Uncharacterized protein n=1 Tax=Cordyceps javanica TaxID=43265 RepID=A0A545V100_9HYPO|nr:hypothetical protein IF1G_06373 [Cordyceps javanica]